MKSIAVITDIQRFSVHDGPGIRTTVFFKGCPLRCLWCQNPETNKKQQEILFKSDFCIGCRRCLELCPRKCIYLKGEYLYTDRILCNNCGVCTVHCPSLARVLVGKEYTVEELFLELIKDRVFFQNSGGGVTLSGGEPIIYSEFCGALLDKLRLEGVHTAIETCGYADYKDFLFVAERVDLVLLDIKLADSDKHVQFTGVSNKRILKNLDALIEKNINTIIRVPLIKGVNDSKKSIEGISKICLDRGIRSIHIMPFHQMGQSKWHALDLDYMFDNVPSMDDTRILQVKSYYNSLGIDVNIGGYV